MSRSTRNPQHRRQRDSGLLTAGNFAGATFVGLEPANPFDITAADLHALAMLSVSVGPGATRRLLLPGEVRESVLTALKRLPLTMRLEAADESDFAKMDDFYQTVKRHLSAPATRNKDPWVTASKLAARKRPALFPVRDNVVSGYLGLLDFPPAERDWRVYQHLLGCSDVQTGLDSAQEATRELASADDLQVVFDDERLRLLDAVLWTAGSEGGPSHRR